MRRGTLVVVVGAVVVATGLVSAAVAVGGSRQSTATATKVWASTNEFSQGVTDVVRDANAVDQAIARHRTVKAIQTSCLYLYHDAGGEWNDLLPTPDPQLTQLLDVAYVAYVQAATRCDLHATGAGELATVELDLHRAFGELVASVLREEAVTGTSLRIRGIP